MAASDKCQELSVTDALQEEDFAVSKSSADDTLFDTTIGHIEDIMMEDDFQKLQRNFLHKYYKEFDDTEENKFIYTDIHKSYVAIVEKYIENALIKRIPGFSMSGFQKMLTAHRDELNGEVFEVLLTFSDFVAFKELMLDYKAEREGRVMNMAPELLVSSLQRSVSCPAPAPSTLEPVRRNQAPVDNGLSLAGQGLSITGNSPLSLTGMRSALPPVASASSATSAAAAVNVNPSTTPVTGPSGMFNSGQNASAGFVDSSGDNLDHEPMVISPRESYDM